MKNITKILLACGIIAFPIYVGVDALSAILYQGYSYLNQAPSELSAIGAPTVWLWLILNFIFNPLMIAFGLGVRRAAAGKRPLRVTGALLVFWGILGFFWLLFPMHMRGNIGSATDTGHLVMAALTVLTMTIFIAFGSGASGKLFRLYSILTILVMLSFGTYVGMQAPRVAAQLPTPWMGFIERISVFSPMLWVFVLAVILRRRLDEARNPAAGEFAKIQASKTQ